MCTSNCFINYNYCYNNLGYGNWEVEVGTLDYGIG